MNKKVSELCVHVLSFVSAEETAQFTSSDFAARRSYSGPTGGHSPPMHGHPSFPDHVFWTCGNKSSQHPSGITNW